MTNHLNSTFCNTKCMLFSHFASFSTAIMYSANVCSKQLYIPGTSSHFSPPCEIHTHTHPFNGLFSGITQVSRYQKGKTNLDFTEERDSEWQWHQLGYMQVCTLLQTNNHTSTPPLCFLQAGCPSCRPTNSVKALKAASCEITTNKNSSTLINIISSSFMQHSTYLIDAFFNLIAGDFK